VNSVAPAGFATDRAKELGFLPELAKASALGRAAEPVEMAEWIVKMASSRNTYAAGENVVSALMGSYFGIMDHVVGWMQSKEDCRRKARAGISHSIF